MIKRAAICAMYAVIFSVAINGCPNWLVWGGFAALSVCVFWVVYR